MAQTTPKGMRLHIGIFGRRNVGKSSILNALTKQNVSIVSEFAGTTTDPVEKPMELLPIGPVLFIDTAGVDDVGALGELRIKKTQAIFDRVDLGVVVTDGVWGDFEESILSQLQSRKVPVVAVLNKCDLTNPDPETVSKLSAKNIKQVLVSALSGDGISNLKQAFIDLAPEDFINNPSMLGDLVGSSGVCVLVVPIDKEAPKGRLILPQVQAIRDLLDSDSLALVVKERELRHAISMLSEKPRLVVTDSQAFLKVSADTPNDIPMTSFSILLARQKGDLATQVQGTLAIDSLCTGDKVLIAEACTHHPITEDIGRVKIPRWLAQYTGSQLDFEFHAGHDFPEDLSKYKLVIMCGGCMFGRRETVNRIQKCVSAGVSVSNYGLAIAYSLGIFERALKSFPSAHDIYMTYLKQKAKN
jgi:[FeFe] hydrogenase H-cluster maturation GTPase HydF